MRKEGENAVSLLKIFGKIFQPKSKNVYLVYLNEIKPNPRFSKIGEEKYKRKWNYFRETGEFESQIVLRRSDWQIMDGFSSYVIAKKAEIDKVPVVFVD